MHPETLAPERSTRTILRLPISQITTGPLNMRSAMDPEQLSDLALSLSRFGQHTPISVIQKGHMFELIFGHRRCAAAQLLKWTHIDGIVEDRDDPQLWGLAWSENHNREDVAPSDQAEILDRMRCANGWTQQQLSAVTGMSESQLSDLLAILRYPEPLREALDAAAISHGVARALNRIDDDPTMMFYLTQACEHGCTARAAEEWVRNWRLSRMPAPLDADELVDANPAPPGPGTFHNTCTACHTTSPKPLTFVAVCSDCADTIRNPAAA